MPIDLNEGDDASDDEGAQGNAPAAARTDMQRVGDMQSAIDWRASEGLKEVLVDPRGADDPRAAERFKAKLLTSTPEDVDERCIMDNYLEIFPECI